MSEDPWDDWETAADAGLIDCNIPEQKPTAVAATSSTAIKNKKLWEKANEYATPIIIHSNTIHTEYKPELKILKRPEDAKNRKDTVMEKPIKALADREKDYLEARRKIFEKFDDIQNKK